MDNEGFVKITRRPKLIDDDIIREIIYNKPKYVESKSNTIITSVKNYIYVYIENHLIAFFIVIVVIIFLLYRFIVHYFEPYVTNKNNKKHFNDIIYKNLIVKPKKKKIKSKKLSLEKIIESPKNIDKRIPTLRQLNIINSSAYVPSNLQETVNYHTHNF